MLHWHTFEHFVLNVTVFVITCTRHSVLLSFLEQVLGMVMSVSMTSCGVNFYFKKTPLLSSIAHCRTQWLTCSLLPLNCFLRHTGYHKKIRTLLDASMLIPVARVQRIKSTFWTSCWEISTQFYKLIYDSSHSHLSFLETHHYVPLTVGLWNCRQQREQRQSDTEAGHHAVCLEERNDIPVLWLTSWYKAVLWLRVLFLPTTSSNGGKTMNTYNKCLYLLEPANAGHEGSSHTDWTC